VRHARPHHRRRSRRHEHGKAFNQSFAAALAQVFHPEQAEGQRAVHRRLQLLLIHAQNRRPRIAAVHGATRVHRAEGTLQVGGRRELVQFVRGKLAPDQPAEQRFVLRARRVLGRRSAPVAVEADFQLRGTRVAETQHRELEPVLAALHLQHAPHHVAFVRPQMQQALAVLLGDRISRLAKVERDHAVLSHHGVNRAGEKRLQLAR
jgi:hypothetical protein